MKKYNDNASPPIIKITEAPTQDISLNKPPNIDIENPKFFNLSIILKFSKSNKNIS